VEGSAWDTTGNDGRLRDNLGKAERKQEPSQENMNVPEGTGLRWVQFRIPASL